MNLERTTVFLLPDSIIADILSRLDIKSLLKSKSVCKSWYFLISDDQLLKHLKLKHDVTACVLFGPRQFGRQMCTEGGLMFSYGGLGQISEFRLSQVNSGASLMVSGSDKGILCLSEYSKNTTIHLWNPKTREVKTLPSPSCHFWQNFRFRVGFGYDQLTNDFKVVRVSRPLYDEREYTSDIGRGVFCKHTRVLVYSLLSNSWKKIHWHKLVLYSYEVNSDCSVVVNGHVHWCLCHGESLPFEFVAFDLNTEVFKLIKAPNERIESNLVTCMGKLSECLSFIYCDKPGLIKIYVMKEYGVSDSWVQQVIDLSYCRLRWSPSLESSQHPHIPRKKFKPIAFGNNGYVLCWVSEGLFFIIQTLTVSNMYAHKWMLLVLLIMLRAIVF